MSDPIEVEEREELPFVFGLLVKVARGVRRATLRIVRRISPRNQFRLVGVLVLLVFVSMVYFSVRDLPNAVGVLRGVGAGLFLALLTALGGLSLVVGARDKPARPDTGAPRVTALQQLLEPTLRELRAVRRDVIRRVRVRSVWCVPVAMGLSALVWQLNSSSPERPGLPTFLFFGALAGEMWAAHRLGKEYERLYKDRVLPQLAAQLGDLTYRKPATTEIQKLRTYRILQDAGAITAEDEIVGTYRGLSLSIIEVDVRAKKSSNHEGSVFDGLVVSLALPRAMTGATVIAADRGLFGNLRETLRMGGFERVSLEDPRFEDRFQVYGTDQIQARALLTPAFMERFSAFASGARAPGAWAEGNTLVLALPNRTGKNLFEPPAYWQPTGGRALLELHRDIADVLRTADTVIELDFWAKGRAAFATPPPVASDSLPR